MRLVTDHLREACARDPAALAVACGERRVSYGELEASSDKIARALSASGVRARERVALLMAKSEAAVASMHAVLKLGCSYVPIDPTSPAQKTIDTLTLCAARILVVDTVPRPALEAALVHASGVRIYAVWRLLAMANSLTSPFERAAVSEQQEAAVLTTSGSTGQPRGAIITHENLAAFMSWAVERFRLEPRDRLLSHAPIQFDLSFLDLFAATAAGAGTVLASSADSSSPQRLSRLVRASGVTVWQSVPSALTLLVEARQRGVLPMPAVRAVLFAGERMPRKTLLELPALFPGASLYNIFGATETNDTFIYDVPSNPEQAPDPLPIGRPLPYVRYRIVDERGNAVPPSGQGNLLVAAPTVMAGYVSRERVTGAARLAEPTAAAAEYYATKDVVSLGDDGYVYFHGRTDSVVKANGFRVNTLEVEDHLRSFPRVDEAAVVAVPDDVAGSRIVAVVRLVEGAQCSVLDLKLHCAGRLPTYAVPHRFEIVRQPLPVSATGKIDKRRLVANLTVDPARDHACQSGEWCHGQS